MEETRTAFVPVPFSRMPPGALAGLSIYLRVGEDYTLYAAPGTAFTVEHRRRLEAVRIRFVYLPEGDIGRFHRQIEEELPAIPQDESLSAASKSEIVYDTSVELVSELLINPNLAEAQRRLGRVARAITALVLLDPHAFANLFIATHHDAYLATHMVNVGAWMVPLALAMGISDADELATICLAGILHDIGKIFVPADLLLTQLPLTPEDIADLRLHAQLGADFIRRHTTFDDRIARVALQHHERLDGSGYPAGIFGDAIDPITRMCSVVDAFDAMTAYRPYKATNRSAAETLAILQSETPLKFDRAAMDAWCAMVTEAHPDLADEMPVESEPLVTGKRRFRRHRVRCAASVELLTQRGNQWLRSAPLTAAAHNISQEGMALLIGAAIQPGQFLRITLHGEGALGRTVDALAVRCRQFPADLHDIGLQFVDLTTETQTLSAEDILYIRNEQSKNA